MCGWVERKRGVKYKQGFPMSSGFRQKQEGEKIKKEREEESGRKEGKRERKEGMKEGRTAGAPVQRMLCVSVPAVDGCCSVLARQRLLGGKKKKKKNTKKKKREEVGIKRKRRTK